MPKAQSKSLKKSSGRKSRSSFLSLFTGSSGSRKKKKTGLLGKKQPIAARLVVFMAAVVFVGGYVLLSHSFAAAAPPEVASGVTGMCLDDLKNNSANDAKVDLFQCNGTAAQQWTLSNNQVMLHGKCLDVFQQGTKAGSVVDLFTCNKGTNQQWIPVLGRLVGVQSGLCLQATGTTNKAPIQLAACDASAVEQWKFQPYTPVATTNPVTQQSPAPGASSTPATNTPKEVASGISGKCLDDYRNNSANDAIVDIFTCNGSNAQQWAINTNGEVTIHGKCLDVFQQGVTNGQIVDLFTCNNGANQKWTNTNDMLVGVQSGKCLQAPNSNNGEQLQIWTCNTNIATNANQRWFQSVYTGSTTAASSAVGSGSVTSSSGPTVSTTPVSTTSSTVTTPVIASGIAGKCLDDFDDNSTNDNKVDINTCNGTASQEWTFASNQLMVNGKCLDVFQQGTANHSKVDLFTCNKGGNQYWTYTGGSFVGKQSGKCLDDPSSTTVNGTQLQIFGCNGTAAQQWSFKTYTGPNPFAPKPCPTIQPVSGVVVPQILCPQI